MVHVCIDTVYVSLYIYIYTYIYIQIHVYHYTTNQTGSIEYQRTNEFGIIPCLSYVIVQPFIGLTNWICEDQELLGSIFSVLDQPFGLIPKPSS